MQKQPNCLFNLIGSFLHPTNELRSGTSFIHLLSNKIIARMNTDYTSDIKQPFTT
jgi:hypothetical protein